MKVRRAVERAVGAVLFGAVAGTVEARWRRSAHRSLLDRPDATGSARRSGAADAEAEVPDAVLIARVRDRAAVPDGIEVTMIDGAVVLFGRVMRSALIPLLQRVGSVEGVFAVENRLTPVDTPFERPPA